MFYYSLVHDNLLSHYKYFSTVSQNIWKANSCTCICANSAQCMCVYHAMFTLSLLCALICIPLLGQNGH